MAVALCFFFLRRITITARIIMPIAARPPSTPPTIGASGVDFFSAVVTGAGVGPGVDVVLGVVVGVSDRPVLVDGSSVVVDLSVLMEPSVVLVSPVTVINQASTLWTR